MSVFISVAIIPYSAFFFYRGSSFCPPLCFRARRAFTAESAASAVSWRSTSIMMLYRIIPQGTAVSICSHSCSVLPAMKTTAAPMTSVPKAAFAASRATAADAMLLKQYTALMSVITDSTISVASAAPNTPQIGMNSRFSDMFRNTATIWDMRPIFSFRCGTMTTWFRNVPNASTKMMGQSTFIVLTAGRYCSPQNSTRSGSASRNRPAEAGSAKNTVRLSHL